MLDRHVEHLRCRAEQEDRSSVEANRVKFVEHAHDMGMLLVHHSLVDCQFFGFVP